MGTSEGERGGHGGQQSERGGRDSPTGGILLTPVLVHVRFGADRRPHQSEVGLVQVQLALQKRLQPARHQPQVFGRVESKRVRPLKRLFLLDKEKLIILFLFDPARL